MIGIGLLLKMSDVGSGVRETVRVLESHSYLTGSYTLLPDSIQGIPIYLATHEQYSQTPWSSGILEFISV